MANLEIIRNIFNPSNTPLILLKRLKNDVSPTFPFVHTSVLAHFPENLRIRIFGFLLKKTISRKVTFSLLHRKFENSPFLAKNDPKWTLLAQNDQKWFAFFSKLLIGISFFENGYSWPKLAQIWPKTEVFAF